MKTIYQLALALVKQGYDRRDALRLAKTVCTRKHIFAWSKSDVPFLLLKTNLESYYHENHERNQAQRRFHASQGLARHLHPW